jgi:hypothetical protein
MELQYPSHVEKLPLIEFNFLGDIVLNFKWDVSSNQYVQQ